MKDFLDLIKIGTCSWKYPSWKGIIYSKTHHYSHNKDKNTPLIENPFFLSPELFFKFLDRLHPMQNNIAAFIFQFEYLNKQKMPGQNIFQEKFFNFIEKCPPGLPYCLEIRNPKYLNEDYFSFLKSNHLSHVFLQGYYMPPIFDVYERYHDFIERFAMIRLLGRHRKEIEDKSQGNWNRLLEPKDQELDRLAKIMHDLMIKNVRLLINVNNHYEGSAPLTIERLISRFNKLES